MNRRKLILPLLLTVAGVLLWFVLPRAPTPEEPAPPPLSVTLSRPPGAARPRPPAPAGIDAATLVQAQAALLQLLQSRFERTDARAGEAILTFNSDEARRRFLERQAGSGLALLDQIDALNSVRVRYDSLDALQRELQAWAVDYTEAGANFLVRAPTVPAPEDRTSVDEVPFGNRVLDFLGATGDRSAWGEGVTIAVLDSGVAAETTFGDRLRPFDIGAGMAPGTGDGDGHGTAVASLAAGADPQSPGVAPAASLLSIRVTDAEGLSDVFTIARGIVEAVDAGARIVNVSMGGYQTSAALTQAIGYATDRGALIVAAAGNDQAAQLTWPAADPRVISVGSVDALGQQVSFSNSGQQLRLTAPGYGVHAAAPNGELVTFDGTSASAPLVAGAIAAAMSTNPGTSAADAWNLVRTFASEGGVIGADSSYGGGILNLGSLMNRQTATYHDTAIASHYYEPSSGTAVFVVQNRGSQSLAGLRLAVSTDNAPAAAYAVPSLAPNASTAVRIPVDTAALLAAGSLRFSSQLINPAGITDAIPANNRRSGVLYLPVAAP